MKRPGIITRMFRLFKKAEKEDLSKEIRELEELVEDLQRIREKPEPKKEEPKDKIQTLADELLGQMKRV